MEQKEGVRPAAGRVEGRAADQDDPFRHGGDRARATRLRAGRGLTKSADAGVRDRDAKLVGEPQQLRRSRPGRRRATPQGPRDDRHRRRPTAVGQVPALPRLHPHELAGPVRVSVEHLVLLVDVRLTPRTITNHSDLFRTLDGNGPHAAQFDLLEYSEAEVCVAIPLGVGGEAGCVALSLPVSQRHRLIEAARTLSSRSAILLISLLLSTSPPRLEPGRQSAPARPAPVSAPATWFLSLPRFPANGSTRTLPDHCPPTQPGSPEHRNRFPSTRTAPTYGASSRPCSPATTTNPNRSFLTHPRHSTGNTYTARPCADAATGARRRTAARPGSVRWPTARSLCWCR